MTTNNTTRTTYLAIAKGNGRFGVSEILNGCSDVRPIGGCRDFESFEEADDVAKGMAHGKFPELRPAGIYVSNR